MGRDRKTSITQEVAKIVFPVSRRPSITSSFSLPSLSLSSRSKPTPVLAPLDTSRANSHPLDNGSAISSFITPSVSQPNTLELSHSPSLSISPMKPLSSPGTSVPLPSIRSLRSRFSLTTQDPPNLPGIALQTPPPKRVTSRRFLPFGNSASSNQSATSTPSIPRKSLGEVFALGRTSTSSRYDSTSSRSVTPSTKSSRSVASVGTMRGLWSHGSGYSTLAPPHPASSPRPHSEDFTELGYVVAIDSGDDTIRGRPDPPPAEPPPRLRESSQTIIESSRENLSQMTLSPPVEIPSPTLPEFVPSYSQPATGSGAPNSNLTNQPGNVIRRRQSPVPPIAIPPPALPIQLEGANKTPATAIDSEGEDPDGLPNAFPFTPIDDRSDVTSSTNNTPHSGDRSCLPPSIPPPLPSPSPRPETDPQSGFPFLNTLPPLVNPIPGVTGDQSRRKGQIVEPGSAANFNTIHSATASVSEKPSASTGRLDRESPRHGASGAIAKAITGSATTSLDFGRNHSTKSVWGLVEEQSGPLSHLVPKVEVCSNGILPIDFDPHASHPDRLNYLLSVLCSPTSDGTCPPTASGEGSDLSGMNDAASKNALAQSSILTQSRQLELVSRPGQPATSPVKDINQDGRYLNTIEDDLAKLLSPHRLSPPADRSEPRQLQTPASTHVPLPSASLTPQPSPLQRAGTRLPLPGSSPSPSVLSSRVNDLLSAKSSVNVQRGAPVERNAVSLNGSPMLSPGKLSSPGSWGTEQANYREVMTTPNNPTRLLPQRSPSAGAVITRKRSASFDSSESPIFTRDTSDPFASHSAGPKRTDWLGPRTAKAFAAAGLIDKERERSGLYSGPRSETPSHRGGALNSWRTHGERNGGVFGSGAGSFRSHSRLGSEIISPSFRTRSLVGGDSSPSYRRSSLDHTAPPSPVSTHRTLVSSVTSSSHSQSALQTMRERHELETEALLLSLAGSKRTERDLRAENEELTTYIVQLERRIAILEAEKEQAERSQSRAREYRWNTPSPSDVETLDKRRQEILAGRQSGRGWINSNKSAAFGGRSPLYGRPPLSAGQARSASAASVYRPANEFDRVSPSKPWDTADSRTSPHNPSFSAASTPTKSNVNQSLAEVSATTRDDFDDWSEPPSFSQPLQSSPRLEARNRLSSHSIASLVPQMPGNMSMLVHEQPGGDFGEDEISFRSASPSSVTLVHRRSNTPKPTTANISPITADFSFNSVPGSPRSLRLGPDEEMHLADLISLQGLEITDIITSLDA
ncbi:hypothetical protein B0J17DRAFT_676109 [Rhizoctonia solani]|nr:hypothetical protein B0J17DRAFT_676109 [Rhizoctonia solani]